ncbi:LysR substrate-binding domain-containing protein [Azospirillum sp.]|uniref:LysR substrate-binding domain-containing protein n=1 Tax=Azospirillum sp. TaxID=34012 RepID=UPI00260C2FF2|nr:LysR substrate-binding domain-containing protein [Azospirillum sp.]
MDSAPRAYRLRGAAPTRTLQHQPGHPPNDGALLRDWVLGGGGVAYKSWLDVAADLRADRLRRVLPQWRGEDAPLQLLFGSGPQRPLRVDALADHLAARIAAHAAAFAGDDPTLAR